MSDQMNLIVITPPKRLREASSLGRPLAHFAYRLGAGGALYRGALPFDTRGGLMALDCEGFDGTGRPVDFAAAVLQECMRQRFDGVVCLFGESGAAQRAPFVSALDEALHYKSWRLFVPEYDAVQAPHATVFLSSAIAGGSLQELLAEGKEAFGSVALLAEVRRECFSLPAAEGRGRMLTAGELADKLSYRPTVHTSPALSTRYFTEYQRTSGVQLVLYDDQSTMQDKFRIAGEAGVRDVLAFAEDLV